MRAYRNDLELKYCSTSLVEEEGAEEGVISGYASLFDREDRSGDIVAKGAFAESLAHAQENNVKIKMLWQHDISRPIGIWDEVREDERGLYVKGRVINEIQAGKEAISLVRAGALDGLSIGYQAKQTAKGQNGKRVLKSVDLWEISLVTFPMMPEARANISLPQMAEGKSLHSILDELREMRAIIETQY